MAALGSKMRRSRRYRFLGVRMCYLSFIYSNATNATNAKNNQTNNAEEVPKKVDNA